MNDGYWIVVWSEPPDATRHHTHDDVIATILETDGDRIDPNVHEVIERSEAGVSILDAALLETVCADYLSNVRTERAHRATLRREYREAVL